MRNKVLLASGLIIAYIGNAFGQKIEFKVQFSEPLAVLEFISHITKNSPPNVYKNRFDSSAYNSDKYRALLTKFEGLNYVYWYEYTQYPYGNKIGGSTYFLLCKNLIESKTIDEFESKSIGIIPSSDLHELSGILSEFVPVYREVIFKPCEVDLKKQIVLIEKKIKETDVSLIIQKIKTFHNSSWTTKKPFSLNICTTPSTKSLNATAFFNYAFGNIPARHADIDLILSFIFHEAFHIIYDEQSLDFKLEFDKWFKENPSRYSEYAELLFNEAITTALSSGYLYKTSTGAMMPNEKWYSNKFIATMAVDIYPMTSQYLAENKTIDKAFIDKYISLYEKKGKDWLLAPDNVLGDRYIITEDRAAFRTISKLYPRRSIDEYSDQLNLLTLEKMKSLPITKVVLITKDNQAKLDLVKQTFTGLKEWHPDHTSDFVYSYFLPDKTYIVIVNSVKKQIGELLTEIKFD